MARRRGKFIVLEGGDGSGKSTAIRHLKEALKDERILFTREPGGTPLGKTFREILLSEHMDALTELMLFSADRREHLSQVIVPTLRSGVHVICDRFDASTYAYQVYARDKEKHKHFFDMLNPELTREARPDLYIFLDVPTSVAKERMEARTEKMTKFDKAKSAFHRRVNAGYKKFLRGVPHVTIDAAANIDVMNLNIEREVRIVLSGR